MDGLLPFSEVPFVHLLERINHLFSRTPHKRTADFVSSGLVVEGNVRDTPLAGTPTVPSPLVTRLSLWLKDRLLWEVLVLLPAAQEVVQSPIKKAELGSSLCTMVTDGRLTQSRREEACSFLTTHLSTKMSPNGHLLSMPGHEELGPCSPSFLPSYRTASGLISPPPHSLRTTCLLEC